MGCFTSIAGRIALTMAARLRQPESVADEVRREDRVETHDSGDIDSFADEADAISCAKA